MSRPNPAVLKLLLAALLAAVFTTTAVVASPESASAATCYGDWCSGQDPMSSGCYADAYTTKSYNLGTAVLQVRWSPACKTNWARLAATGDGCVYGGTLYAIQDTGYTQSASIPYNTCYSSDVFWTPMIYSPVHQVKAKYSNWQGSVYVTAWS